MDCQLIKKLKIFFTLIHLLNNLFRIYCMHY